MAFPSFSQWKQIFKVLKRKERITLLAFFVVALASFAFLVTHFYLQNTNEVPSNGGVFVEGIVGQPRFVNPIYGETGDIDRTLIDLVFSGLMTYDREGKIVKDLAENYTISSDGKVYTFTLKGNAFWHDGQPLSADDVIFTIKTIQNSDYKSPLRASWVDVDVQKVSESTVRFTLRSPYNSFLETCALRILPKHIWQNILAENFLLSSYNLQPIGSGPFEFVKITQTETGFIKTFDLQKNAGYHNHPPYIANLSFHFFERKEDLVRAINQKEIHGFAFSSLENGKTAQQQVTPSFSTHYFSLPRYVAVFFNASLNKTSVLADVNVRRAIWHATNKDELVQKLNESGSVIKISSPILPEFFEYQQPTALYDFDQEKAKTLLNKSGYKENGQGFYEKAVSKKPAFQFSGYLKKGSKSEEVNQLQLCLARLDENLKNILKGEKAATYGQKTEDAVTAFQKKYLPNEDATGETGKATRAKLNELCITSSPNSQVLKFVVTTIDQPQLVMAAQLLKEQWSQVGILVDINAVPLSDLKTIIKKRSYEALLYGETLGAEPDLFPFWHSSQKVDPGLNLSYYENKDVDKLLKEARETSDPSVKKQKYEQLQNVLLNDSPALFLYNPDYAYWVSDNIHGINTSKIIDPAKRFSNITNWFIKTKRVWK